MKRSSFFQLRRKFGADFAPAILFDDRCGILTIQGNLDRLEFPPNSDQNDLSLSLGPKFRSFAAVSNSKFLQNQFTNFFKTFRQLYYTINFHRIIN